MVNLKLEEHKTNNAVLQAINVLQNGGVIAYPTETFYGLGARFDISDSLKRLYKLKRRPKEKAMPLIIGSMELLRMIVSAKWLDNTPLVASLLMKNFWPGPLTMLFPAKEGLSEHLSAGTGKVAARIPGESFALQLAKRAGFPITATSANISGKPPIEKADDIIGYFGDAIDLLVDGGATPGGLPSTIVDVSDNSAKIVREGIISRNDIERLMKNKT